MIVLSMHTAVSDHEIILFINLNVNVKGIRPSLHNDTKLQLEIKLVSSYTIVKWCNI